MELTGLHIDITIGSYQVYRAPAWWIESRRGNPLGRAGVTLPDPEGELFQTIKKGDPITIEVGYRDQDPVTWSGSVGDVAPGDTPDQLEVRAVDGALALTTTRVVQAWENETPEAIVAWAIRQTGLSIGVIDPTEIVIPRFVASNTPVWQLVRQVAESCQRSFGLDMTARALWLGNNGVNWSTGDEPGSVPVINSQYGLLDHQPTTVGNASPMIETWLQADLTHSRLIHLQDDRRGIDTTFRAQRVRHQGTPDTTRTFIWY